MAIFDKLLFHLRIKLEDSDYSKLIRKTIQNPNELNSYDIRRIFKILFLKEELGDVFKDLLGISHEEIIGK